MRKPTIDELSAEANRLLKVNLDLLSELQNDPDILTEEHAGAKQTLDRSSIGKAIEIIKGEQEKLKNLDMVLAVVGPMKCHCRYRGVAQP